MTDASDDREVIVEPLLNGLVIRERGVRGAWIYSEDTIPLSAFN